MKRALGLARQALGTTSPNPAVGAVLVRDGAIVGEGHTQPPGRSHAEIVALQAAGETSCGASLYVTLEPCCVYGRTPPCTQAILAAGVQEVHVSSLDPNPRVNGRGVQEMERAGTTVVLGEEQETSGELYEAFAKHISTRMPFVTAKFASSLDGKIATRTGDSRWITGSQARLHVHQMRAASDAIMVGVNTVLRDNPQLTARDEQGNALSVQPLRVILDSTGRTPRDARLLGEPGHTLVAVASGASAARAGLEAAGAEVLEVPATAEGRVDPYSLLRTLGERGIVSVLVEGGGTLLGSLFDSGLVDKAVGFVAPAIIGGSSAPSPVGGEGPALMSQITRLARTRVETVGDDIMVVGYPQVDGQSHSPGEQ